jgi:hypothetical protein
MQGSSMRLLKIPQRWPWLSEKALEAISQPFRIVKLALFPTLCVRPQPL